MNKASGGDGIPAELFQILREYTVKVLHSICQHIWKTQQWPQDQKRPVFIAIPKKECHRMFKLPHNCTHFTCQQGNSQNPSSQASTVCVSRTSRYTNWVQKRQELEIKLPRSAGSQKKHENSRKTSTSASLTVLKPLTVWITTNCGKFLKRWEYRTTLPVT